MCADGIIVSKPQEILHGSKVRDHSGQSAKCFSALEVDDGVGGKILFVFPNKHTHTTAGLGHI